MAVADVIVSYFGNDNFADYEQSVYDKYQEIAECEIIDNLNFTLSSMPFLQLLKAWGAKCACKSHGFRQIKIQLKSGQKREVFSPVFLKARSKKKADHRNDRRVL